MDTTQAILLVAAIIGVVQLAKTFVWGTTKERITAGIVLGSAIAMTFLVSTSAWGDEQVLGGEQLDDLGWSSLLLVGIVLGAMASTGWEAFTTIRNVGVPMPSKVQQAAADKGAAAYAAAELPDGGGSHDTAVTPGMKFADD
jgi:hypothetical protein